MTAIGQSTVKTVFAIDYIDLDYGYIGGSYSVGISGPAYGGGNGYMLLRLPRNAYPLDPSLQAPAQIPQKKRSPQTRSSTAAVGSILGKPTTVFPLRTALKSSRCLNRQKRQRRHQLR